VVFLRNHDVAGFGSNSIVVDDAILGKLVWNASDAVDFHTEVATFDVEVDDASPAAGDIGAAFTWNQMPGGGGAIAETMRLTASGRLGINDVAPAARLEVNQDAADAVPALLVTLNDVDQTGVLINADTLTTGTILQIDADALTSGTVINIKSTSTAIVAPALFDLSMSANLSPAGNITPTLFEVVASFNFLTDEPSFTYSGSGFKVRRALVTAGFLNTLTITQTLMAVENSIADVTGTVTDTAETLSILQDIDSSAGITLSVIDPRNDTNTAITVWTSFGGTQKFIVQADGCTAIGPTAPAAMLHVDQSSTTAAKPVITLDQADVDEDYFKFIGTSLDASADRALVDAANFTTPGSIVGWLKINVQDDQGTNPITDGDYYIPFYSVPTA